MADVSDVAEIFLACSVLNPQALHPFFELRCELDENEFQQYDTRLSARNVNAMRRANSTIARAVVLALAG
jgi:hypothetical protein